MSDQRNQQNQRGGQKSNQQRQQPNHSSVHMATDEVSFYDESLKKEIEGSFVSDGKSIHVSSVYGAKSASYGDLGACIDRNAQVLLAQKLLSELARDPGVGQKGDQQANQKPLQGKQQRGGQGEGGGSQGGVGTPP